jgi:diguanylate cyclase (GGDEF)-like protein/PAS domain S-box-containing protein
VKKIKFGLIARVATLVVAIEVAAFSTLGWFYIDRFSSEMVQRTHASMRRVGELIASEQLPISVISQKKLLTDLIGEPYLNGMVVGGNGHVIVSTTPEYLGRRASEVDAIEPDWLLEAQGEMSVIPADATLTAVQAIKNSSGGALYHVVFTISTAALNAKRANIALMGVAGSALFILLTSLLVVYVAHRLITRRVKATVRVLEKIEHGALQERIPVTQQDEIGQIQAGINSMTDELAELINRSRENAAELQEQKDLLQSVIQTAPIRVFWKDKNSRFVGCNTRFAKDAGYASPEELVGKTDYDMIWQEQADRFHADDLAVMESGQAKIDYEIYRQSPEGEPVWLSASKVPLRDDDGQIIGVLGIYSDITAKKQAEDEIRNLAYFDPLTGLPNRRLIMDHLEEALNNSTRHQQYAALLMLDLDNFKDLNDSRGHGIGDLLLREVGHRIADSVGEMGSVGRFGGDEFVVIIEMLGSDESVAAQQAMKLAEKIRARIDRKFEFKRVGLSHYITPSIGVTLFKDEENSVEDLLKQADVALYQAKSSGRNAIRFYSPMMQTQLNERTRMTAGLRRALDNGELALYYQPQVDSDGTITGAEALLRWLPRQGTPVSPGQFIPLAEESGLIIPIGDWVLGQACDQLKAWEREPDKRRLAIAVNVSSLQFRQKDFTQRVCRHIDRTGIDPTRLKLELTESVVLADVDETVQKMEEIRQLGVTFSLDDFGTGFSSLSYLKRLPLAQLKIDQGFVRDLLSDQSDAAIVRAILAMSASLGIEAIAEGVETQGQYNFLHQHGCRHYQGYLFGKPLPIEAWEKT